MPRNLFRDPNNGDVYEYDDDQVLAGLVRKGIVPMTPDDVSAHLAQHALSVNAPRIVELLAQLESIDIQSSRPLRAIVAGTATEEDRARLIELESMATAVRAELTELQP